VVRIVVFAPVPNFKNNLEGPNFSSWTRRL